jgi:hypothetical protein
MRARDPLLSVLALSATLLAATASADPTGFDKDAALRALSGVDLGSCNVKQPGDGHVFITFDTKGKASAVVVDKGEFGSAKVEKCIKGKFKKVTVPPFEGAPVRVGKTFHVQG